MKLLYLCNTVIKGTHKVVDVDVMRGCACCYVLEMSGCASDASHTVDLEYRNGLGILLNDL